MTAQTISRRTGPTPATHPWPNSDTGWHPQPPERTNHGHRDPGPGCPEKPVTEPDPMDAFDWCI